MLMVMTWRSAVSLGFYGEDEFVAIVKSGFDLLNAKYSRTQSSLYFYIELGNYVFGSERRVKLHSNGAFPNKHIRTYG